MKCARCGAVEMVREIRDVPHVYKGQRTILPNVSGDFCAVCHEILMDADEAWRVMDMLKAFREQVNSSTNGGS